MTYKEKIHQEMLWLARQNRVRFIGYNTKYGHQMYGTLKGCEDICIETPVAENLMLGLAMGLSLEGFRPIVCVERASFLLPMADAIINHLYAMPKMSGEFNFPVVLRVVIPTNKPLDPGLQHLGDYTDIIHNHTEIQITHFHHGVYEFALNINRPICIVERKELYESDYSTKSL